MSEVEFTYDGTNITILCQENEKMEEICKRYSIKRSIDINKLCFLYSGTQMNLQLTYNQIINSADKQRNKMSILVYDIDYTNDTTVEDKKLIKSDFPICIKCKENVIFELKDYKINLYGCKNKHIINNILINEYIKNQNIDLSKIECNNCKKKKYEIYNNEMYICNECNIILCPLCKNKHKNHNTINYDLKNYICNKHNESFIAYCNQCKINICMKCQKEHIKHDLKLYGEILPDKNESINKMKQLKIEIDIFNNNINEIIKKLKDISNIMNIYYEINNNIINNYDKQRKIISILVINLNNTD